MQTNQHNTTPVALADGEVRLYDEVDQYGNKKITQGTALPGADYNFDVTKVHEVYASGSKETTDRQVKTGLTRLKSVTFTCNDAAPTAGTIALFNNVGTGGDEVFSHSFSTTPFMPFTVQFNRELANGLFIDFTTTNDVNAYITYE